MSTLPILRRKFRLFTMASKNMSMPLTPSHTYHPLLSSLMIIFLCSALLQLWTHAFLCFLPGGFGHRYFHCFLLVIIQVST